MESSVWSKAKLERRPDTKPSRLHSGGSGANFRDSVWSLLCGLQLSSCCPSSPRHVYPRCRLPCGHGWSCVTRL